MVAAGRWKRGGRDRVGRAKEQRNGRGGKGRCSRAPPTAITCRTAIKHNMIIIGTVKPLVSIAPLSCYRDSVFWIIYRPSYSHVAPCLPWRFAREWLLFEVVSHAWLHIYIWLLVRKTWEMIAYNLIWWPKIDRCTINDCSVLNLEVIATATAPIYIYIYRIFMRTHYIILSFTQFTVRNHILITTNYNNKKYSNDIKIIYILSTRNCDNRTHI